ncbi:MAG: hypothetical protein Ct9H300mP4_16410 [Gammaproteobacteria bacterium]|nr:MAG: hypothetical protein Ct9H300mP4_16410 [Gammaproteobacteria bacterium]
MYAVFKSGGKQYPVSKGEKLKLEKLGTKLEKKLFLKKFFLSEKEVKLILELLSSKATVEAKVLEEGKGKKIEVVKFKRRKNYKRNFGHRQTYSLIEITAINVKKKAAQRKQKLLQRKQRSKQKNNITTRLKIMAHKKAGGSSRNGRDSESKRLGVKKFGGNMFKREILLFVKEEPSFILEEMLG